MLIEIKDPNGREITIDGKPFDGNLGDLKAKFPTVFRILRKKLKEDGKSLKNFGGNDSAPDIIFKSDGEIEVNYDA